MSRDVPETVPCPCGNGYADRRGSVVSNPKGKIRRRVAHNYRHEGCLGGAVVVSCGRIVRRVGPLFQPGRYDVGRVTAAARRPVATDGGTVE